MRKTIETQMKIGEIDISNIDFDLISRDEIPKLLLGLQHIYCTKELQREVFNILEKVILPDIDTKNGRPGMTLWKILVLGTLRLNCNWDYDKVHEIANNHKTLRKMLGHGLEDNEYNYKLQTIRDNVSLLTPEILDKINVAVVKSGHKLLGVVSKELKGRGDSFVVETNVHYPTDINLLWDAIRKVIVLTSRLCTEQDIPGWRQGAHLLKKIKRLFRLVQNLKQSNSKNEKKKEQKLKKIKKAYRIYLKASQAIIANAKTSLSLMHGSSPIFIVKMVEIERFIDQAQRQIEQIERRVLKEEKIKHGEKVFSLFEEHTEWISKGKAGVPQELGLKVALIEDTHGFILHHQIMQHLTDVQVAFSLLKDAKQKFSNLNSCSFDRGFYNPENKIELSKIIEHLILPKKGYKTAEEKEIESGEEFKRNKGKHSAVESAINALENHGLDRCPDHGIKGFERYVALSILARNIQILGNIIQQRKLKELAENEKKKSRKAAA